MTSKPPPSPLLLVGMGTTIAVCVAGGIGAGILIGSEIGASAVLVFVGLAVGLVAAVFTVKSEFKRYM